MNEKRRSPLADMISMGSFLQREGWVDKYRITKMDGRPVDPEAIYFPLRLDNDPYAREAALHYASLISKRNPVLSKQIVEKVKEGEQIHTNRSGYFNEES